MTNIARSMVLILATAVVGCGPAPEHKAGNHDASKQGLPPAKAEQAPPPPAQPTPPAPVVVAPPVEPTPPSEPALPVDVAPPTEPDVAPPTEAVAPTEPTPTPAGGWTPPKNPTDLRGDEVIPPGTSEANAKAFKKLAVAADDGPPVGGIGDNGVHLDALSLGAGWEKSKCAEPTTTFTIGVNDRVNVCMRIVHSRGVSEELSIEWIKNGKSTRRSKVAVSDMHAYLTRGYLPIKTGYEGEWKGVITSADKTVLGEVSFTVK